MSSLTSRQHTTEELQILFFLGGGRSSCAHSQEGLDGELSARVDKFNKCVDIGNTCALMHVH
jgi:hypothetical protein